MSKWLFNNNSPANPENWSIVAPSFYDAPDVDPTFNQSGIVGKNSMAFIKYDLNKQHVILNCGHYAFRNTVMSLFPSESISILITDSTTELPIAPSNVMQPVVESYHYINGICEISRRYQYAPSYIWGTSLENKFKFDISNSGVYSLVLDTTPLTDQSIILNSISTLSNGKHVFVMPEFPCYNPTKPNTVTNWTIDNVRGLIMTSDVTTMSLVYSSAMWLTYIPKNSVETYKIFTDTTIDTENFAVINANLSART